MYHFDLLAEHYSVYCDKYMVRNELFFLESIMFKKNMLTIFVKDLNEVYMKEVWLFFLYITQFSL